MESHRSNLRLYSLLFLNRPLYQYSLLPFRVQLSPLELLYYYGKTSSRKNLAQKYALLIVCTPAEAVTKNEQLSNKEVLKNQCTSRNG